MKKVILMLVFSLPLIVDAKNCNLGIPCGNSCISADKICKIDHVTSQYLSPSINPVQQNTSDTLNKQNFNNAKFNLVKLYNDNANQTTFYCGCEFNLNDKKHMVNFNKCGYQVRKNQNRAQRIEWEHVMPAENFGRHLSCWQNGGRKACKKDILFNQMEGDMHNLQPSIGEINGDRSNYRYSQFTREFHQYGQCKTAVDFKQRKFQPRDEIRGIIARTYFYMSDKYQINLSKQEQQLMAAWDKLYPPTKWECDRNRLITNIQGNDNKFITKHCAK